MREFPLCSDFHYSGAIDSSGRRCSLRDLQIEVKDGWEVYAIDLALGMHGFPCRVFVGTTGSKYHPRAENEALEALRDFCKSNPASAIAGHVFTWELNDEEFAEAEEEGVDTIVIDGKHHRESDGVIGIELIERADMIATCAGGKYQRRVQAVYPGAKLDHNYTQTGLHVWDMIDNKIVILGEAPSIGATAAINAWESAASNLPKEG